ncbi:hypothetical protein [Streptomyces sp. CEV 2-1]|uniref:hypothetical protein n=1 Tax=Streptomyces sp. CEV 2-1 TaxID=2485153 RepID=UPI00160A0B96|nr:hypothetical protein [Streptomyces sp. CEV 2-1]
MTQVRPGLSERTASASPCRPPSTTSTLSDGIGPVWHRADASVAVLTAHYAHLVGRPDDVELRRWLVTRLESINDPRREQYLQLLAVVNGWPAPKSLTAMFDWSIQALRVRAPQWRGGREAAWGERD